MDEELHVVVDISKDLRKRHYEIPQNKFTCPLYMYKRAIYKHKTLWQRIDLTTVKRIVDIDHISSGIYKIQGTSSLLSYLEYHQFYKYVTRRERNMTPIESDHGQQDGELCIQHCKHVERLQNRNIPLFSVVHGSAVYFVIQKMKALSKSDMVIKQKITENQQRVSNSRINHSTWRVKTRQESRTSLLGCTFILFHVNKQLHIYVYVYTCIIYTPC